MPFVLIIAGVVLIISAVRNTQQQLFYLLALDFTGPHNFIFWFISILIIGAVGYIPKAKPLSDGFLILVILVLFLKKGRGFFDMFQSQISATQNARPQVSPTGTSGASSFVGSSPVVGVSLGTPSVTIGGSGGPGITIGGGSGNSGGFPFPGGGLGFPGGSCDPFFDPWCNGGYSPFGPGAGQPTYP